MKQTLILALFAFAVAVAGSTWFVTKVMPPRGAVVDSLRDSAAAKPGTIAKATTPAKGNAADSLGAATGGRDSTRADSGAAKPSRAAPPAGPTQAEIAAAEAEAAVRAKGVGKILAQMKPKEAVDIMAKLSDDEVERILRQLNAKQVAALLPALPGERAGLMSRRLLQPRTGREGGH